MDSFDSIKDAQRLAEMLCQSRYKSQKSQEFMAMGLNVSKNTVYNWEKGTSQPNIKQFINWFKLLGLNPTSYIMQYCNVDESRSLTPSDSEQDINTSLHKIIDSLSIEEKRQLLYLFMGNHGSDPTAFLQMITADLHTPMRCRVNVARTIVDNYEICESCDKIIDTNHVLPNMQKLKSAVELGKTAAINGNLGYSF